MDLKPGQKEKNKTAAPVQRAAAGNLSVVLKDNRPESVAQLTRKKTAKETIGGGIGLGITGAIIGSYLPVVGTIAGGLTGLAIGVVGGYFHSQPKIYPNMHKKDYKDEVEKYEFYREANKESKSAYTRGTIIKYSTSNSKRFTNLLHQGQVLYAYDKNSQLSIGSNAGPIKHAIVAGGESVKAAGMAVQIKSKAEDVYGAYHATAETVKKLQETIEEFEAPALKIVKRLKVDSINDALDSKELKDNDHEILSSYYQSQKRLEYYLEEMRKLSLLERKAPQVSKNNQVQLDNNSGHYHPDKSTKDEAFEGWSDAGFKNLTWKTFK
jgi:hypothetical protein